MVTEASLAEIEREFQRSDEASERDPYYAINDYWLCLIKLSHLLPSTGGEHEQALALLRKLPRGAVSTIVNSDAVDTLLSLEPPLDHVLTSPRERLNPLRTGRNLHRIAERRATDPKAALANLFEILQQIRDRREHGFKTPSGPRDQPILGSASSLLRQLCAACMEALSQEARTLHPSRPGA